jgi:hypothetical protein
MLVTIYWPWTSLRGICGAVGPGQEARPIVGLFNCSWLNLGASISGRCRVRTGGLRMSMRFMGSEEGRVVAVSRTPGPSFVGISVAGAFPSDAASPSKSGGKEVDGSGKAGYSGTQGDRFPWGPLLIWVSPAFYIFPCTWKLLHEPTCFLYVGLYPCGLTEDFILLAVNIMKLICVSRTPTTTSKTLLTMTLSNDPSKGILCQMQASLFCRRS